MINSHVFFSSRPTWSIHITLGHTPSISSSVNETRHVQPSTISLRWLPSSFVPLVPRVRCSRRPKQPYRLMAEVRLPSRNWVDNAKVCRSEGNADKSSKYEANDLA